MNDQSAAPSSLRFGTSGLRGLATDLTGQAARRYITAFLRHMEGMGQLGGGRVFLGRDLRSSSPQIARDCAAAIRAWGLEPVDCGTIPTPALALHAMAANCCAVMITGSHIPADRNGLKFYTPLGEISKADEAAITAALRNELVPDCAAPTPNEGEAAAERYRRRSARLLPPGALSGWRIGVFQHSSVSRDLLVSLLTQAGAQVVPLGRSDVFTAVDTEALGDAVFDPLPNWVRQERLDALVSADGDGDRPLLMDASGAFVRGDVLGLLAA
ncbi:MAG: Phosphoglucomutase/phosphomannomutase alpha/beta/alpha domain, partial [Devosia sp.]|nr:Phosphoglucomutase/phosphomannomutase alpha/beta/alpha domain [Devosia sp.]